MSEKMREELFAELTEWLAESGFELSASEEEEVRAIIAQHLAPQPVSVPEDVAKWLAPMVIEWVDTGIRLGTDWRNGLENIIGLRLQRLEKKTKTKTKPVMVETSERGES